MQIKDLQPRQGKVELTATVIEKGDSRTVNSANFSGTVANAKLKDETGTIKFSLWNDQVGQVNVGDTVKITNGYVSEYQGEMQLSTGKFGKLEVVSKGVSGSEPTSSKPVPAKKEQLYDEYAEDDGADDVSEEFVE
jgi:replication factor A1